GEWIAAGGTGINSEHIAADQAIDRKAGDGRSAGEWGGIDQYRRRTQANFNIGTVALDVERVTVWRPVQRWRSGANGFESHIVAIAALIRDLELVGSNRKHLAFWQVITRGVLEGARDGPGIGFVKDRERVSGGGREAAADGYVERRAGDINGSGDALL